MWKKSSQIFWWNTNWDSEQKQIFRYLAGQQNFLTNPPLAYLNLGYCPAIRLVFPSSVLDCNTIYTRVIRSIIVPGVLLPMLNSDLTVMLYTEIFSWLSLINQWNTVLFIPRLRITYFYRHSHVKCGIFCLFYMEQPESQRNSVISRH